MRNRRERIGRLVRMHANKREDVQELRAGDIGAVVGLKYTVTGDTLCDEAHQIVLESMIFPEPVLAVAIEPKTKTDADKLTVGSALYRQRHARDCRGVWYHSGLYEPVQRLPDR